MNQDTCMKLAVYSVIAIVIILVVRYYLSQENFANEHKHHEHKHAKHGKHAEHKVKHEEKHGHPEHKTPAPVATQSNEPKSENILINSREIVFNSRGDTPYFVQAVGNQDWQQIGYAYGPFGYAATADPVPKGMKLAYRLYAVYSDNMQPASQMNPDFQAPPSTAIQFRFGWNQELGDFTTFLPLTWGDPSMQRDAHTSYFTSDDIAKAGVKDPSMHAAVWIKPTSTQGVTRIYKLYIQTYLVPA
jgi:hypothetical protein